MPHIEEDGFDGFGDAEGGANETTKTPLKRHSMIGREKAQGWGAAVGHPWPATFPDWKGIAILKHDENDDAQRGNGLEIREQEYTQFEWHPDATVYPDIARIMFKLTTTEQPDDAAGYFKENVGHLLLSPSADVRSSDNVIAFEGKPVYYQRYLRVDRERKAFQVVGSKYIKEGSVLHDLFLIDSEPRSEPHGAWQWHLPKSVTDLQYILNADNTVLREVNYANEVVVATGDWTKNCKFNLVMPSKKELAAADIAPAPPSLVDAMLEEIKEYFTADDSMYRSPIDKTTRIIKVSTKFNQVTAIDTPQERFGANVTATFKWQITKDDVVGYVAAPDQDEWQPAYMPPRFEVKNPASGDGAALMMSKYSKVQLIKEADGYKGMQTFTVSGDFWEPFELQNYPFDIQPLGVVLESTAAQDDSVKFVCTCDALPTLRDTEWSGKNGSARAEFAVDQGKKKRGRYTLTIEAVAQRYYSVHMYRVVSVMALFSLGSIGAFCADPDVNALERLGITFTLMLTATAYSLVIASGLPTLGYLTFLDKYILATFAIIATVGAEILVIEWIAARHLTSAGEALYNVEDALEYVAYADLGLWFVIHLSIYIYVTRWVLPEEQTKVDQKAVKEKKKKKKDGKGASSETYAEKDANLY